MATLSWAPGAGVHVVDLQYMYEKFTLSLQYTSYETEAGLMKLSSSKGGPEMSGELTTYGRDL